MLRYIRRLVAGWHSQEVCDLAKEVISLTSQRDGLKKNRDEWRTECQENATRLTVETDLGRFSQSEIVRLSDLLDKANSERETLRQSVANRDATLESVRDEVSRLEGELAAEKHDHAMTTKQLQIAGEENRLLAEIHEGNIARRARELAVEKMGKVSAETEISLMSQRAAQEQAA